MELEFQSSDVSKTRRTEKERGINISSESSPEPHHRRKSPSSIRKDHDRIPLKTTDCSAFVSSASQQAERSNHPRLSSGGGVGGSSSGTTTSGGAGWYSGPSGGTASNDTSQQISISQPHAINHQPPGGSVGSIAPSQLSDSGGGGGAAGGGGGTGGVNNNNNNNNNNSYDGYAVKKKQLQQQSLPKSSLRSGSGRITTSATSAGRCPGRGRDRPAAAARPPARPRRRTARAAVLRATRTTLARRRTCRDDGLFHEYKKHGKVTWVKVVGQNTDRYALVCFKKPEDVEKALEVSHDKLFFGCKIEVAPYAGYYDVDDNEFRPYEAELDEYHPKSTRTLFVGNLEKDITGSELRKQFECFGEIIEIDIKKQGASAYAFCQYSDIVSVVKAMRKMDGEHLGANRIKLGFGKSMPTNCVWLDGVADSASENYLVAQFNHFGTVSQVNVDRERRLALIYYEQVQQAQAAVKEMRGVMLRGRKLQVDFASRECQEAFFDNRPSNPLTAVGNVGAIAGGASPRVDPLSLSSSATSSSTGLLSSSLGAVGGGAGSARGGNGGSGGGGGVGGPMGGVNSSSSSSSRSRIVRYSSEDYYSEGGGNAGGASAGGVGDRIEAPRRFRSYDEYSQGSAASSTHEDDRYDQHEHNNSGVSGSRASGNISSTLIDRLAGGAASLAHHLHHLVGSIESPTAGGSLPGGGGGGLSSTIQSRLGETDLPASAQATGGAAAVGGSSLRKRSEKSSGGDSNNIRYLQKERVHILEQLEECPSSGDELVSPKKRIKYNSDGHHHHHHHHHHGGSDSDRDHHRDLRDPSPGVVVMPGAAGSAAAGVVTAPGGPVGSSGHHFNSGGSTPGGSGPINSSSTSNASGSGSMLHHYNSHHHHHHHHHPHHGSNNSDSGGGTTGGGGPIGGIQSSSALTHRKSMEVRRLSECNIQQSKQSVASASSASSLVSSGNSRRPSTDSSSLQQRHTNSNASSSNNSQHHLSTDGPTTNHSLYSPHHHLSKRRKVIGDGMTPLSTSNEHHHSSRGRGHQLHSIHSHEASGGESADGSRPGTPLCDERPENLLLPSEPRRIPTARAYNQEPMELPLPRFAVQVFQQNRFNAIQQQQQSSSAAGGGSSSASSSASSAAAVSSTVGTGSSSVERQISSGSSSAAVTPSTPSTVATPTTPLPFASTASGGSSAAQSATNSSSAAINPSLSSLATNSSLLQSNSNALTSPPPIAVASASKSSGGSASIGSSLPLLGESSVSELVPASPPPRAPSVSSTSSDSSDLGMSLDERIKTLDEKFEKWSGSTQAASVTRLGGGSGSVNASVPPISGNASELHFGLNDRLHYHHHGSSGKMSSSSSSSFRTKFLDLDVHELPPSDIVKSVLSKKSIFDEDLKRLENIDDKYEPRDFSNYSKHSTALVAASAVLRSRQHPPQANHRCILVRSKRRHQAPRLLLLLRRRCTPTTVSLPRISGSSSSTSVSPMNSPQPYNSPNPSVKSTLQYPFPTVQSTSQPPPPPPPGSTNVGTVKGGSNVGSDDGDRRKLSTASSTSSTSSSSVVSSPNAAAAMAAGASSVDEPAEEAAATAPSVPSSDTSASKSSSKHSSSNKSSSKSNSHHHKDHHHHHHGSGGGGSGHRHHSDSLSSTSSTSSSSSTAKNLHVKENHVEHLPGAGGSSSYRDEFDRLKQEAAAAAAIAAGTTNNNNVNAPSSSSKRRDNKDDEEQQLHHQGHPRQGKSSTEREKDTPAAVVDRHGGEEKEQRKQSREDGMEKEQHEKERGSGRAKGGASSGDTVERESSANQKNHHHRHHHHDEPGAQQQHHHHHHRERSTSDKDRRDRVNSTGSGSPARSSSKRRLSSQDSIESTLEEANTVKKIRSNASQDGQETGSKINERRDSGKESRKEGGKHHHKTSGSGHNHRSEKTSSKTSSSSTATPSSEKVPSSLNNASSKYLQQPGGENHHTSTEKQQQQALLLEERRKEIMLSGEDHLHHHQPPSGASSAGSGSGGGGGGSHHKRKERYHESKHKSKKNRDPSRDKENTQSANFPADSYGENRSTSDEEEQNRRIRYKKERKELQEFAKQRFHHSASSGGGGGSAGGMGLVEASGATPTTGGGGGDHYKKLNCARADRKSSQPVSRAESSAEEGGGIGGPTGGAVREKKKCRSNSSRKPANSNSDDTDDSDEPKKHSIFDIPDDFGPNISMYDKVKARSCKNMQKQEEEKKIRAKFSQLKQCRAKREGKNRSKSWEEGDESDSEDGMNSDGTVNSKYNHHHHHHKEHNKSGMVTTTDDEEEDRVPTTPRSSSRRHHHLKESSLASDSGDEGVFNRDRLNDLCDDESSEGGGNMHGGTAERDKRPHQLEQQPMQKQRQPSYHQEKSSRRSSGEDKKSSSRKGGSRGSTRIQSDTETDDEGTRTNERTKNAVTSGGAAAAMGGNSMIPDAEYDRINDKIGRMFAGSTPYTADVEVKIKKELKSDDETSSHLVEDKKPPSSLTVKMDLSSSSLSGVPKEQKPSVTSTTTTTGSFALIASDISDDDLVKTVVKSEYGQPITTVAVIKQESKDMVASTYKQHKERNREQPPAQPPQACDQSGSDGGDLMAHQLTPKTEQQQQQHSDSKRKHKKKQKRNKTLDGSVGSFEQLEKDPSSAAAVGSGETASIGATTMPASIASLAADGGSGASPTMAPTVVPNATGGNTTSSSSVPTTASNPSTVEESAKAKQQQLVDDHQSSSYNKKKHSGKKEKRRDRSKEDYESKSSSSSRSKKSKNRHKESTSGGGAGGGGSSNSSSSKFLDMDLFGPISDEESQHSSVETEASHGGKQGSLEPDDQGPRMDDDAAKSSSKQQHLQDQQLVVDAPINEPSSKNPTTPAAAMSAERVSSTTTALPSIQSGTGEEPQKEPQQSFGSALRNAGKLPDQQLNATSTGELTEKELARKEESRKRKEKRRREKQRASMAAAAAAAASLKEDENSVDLDEAGRALEAQLMSDTDQQKDEEVEVSPASTVTSGGATVLGEKRTSVDMLDVFRYTDGDDSMEMSFGDKKDPSSGSVITSTTGASSSEHGRKEKKKKKKRGKDEKHKHHHSGSSSGGVNSTGTIAPVAPSTTSLGESVAKSGTLPTNAATTGSSNSSNVHSPIGGNSGGGLQTTNRHPPPTTTPVTPSSINKLSLDIISAQQEDSKHNLSKPSPSLPCLLDESPPPSNKQQLTAQTTSTPAPSTAASSTTAGPMERSASPSSLLLAGADGVHTRELTCSTPTYEFEKKESIDETSSNKSTAKRKKTTSSGTEKLDDQTTQQLHEKAVMSISGELLTSSSSEVASGGEAISSNEDDQQLAAAKQRQADEAAAKLLLEEKSRVVISQEETEDAVAALLGESFGTSNTPDFSDMYSDPVEEEQLKSPNTEDEPPQIPEEDDEEMKKAIMSLNAEELKPDTPQSEHDLQIDTDTDDALDDDHTGGNLLRFDNPPKTPDVDLSQIGKPLIEGAKADKVDKVLVEGAGGIKKDDSLGKLEMPDTPGKHMTLANVDSPSQGSADEAVTSSSGVVVKAPTTTAQSKQSTKVSTSPSGAPAVVSQKIITPASTITIIKEQLRPTVASSVSQTELKPITVGYAPQVSTTVKPASQPPTVVRSGVSIPTTPPSAITTSTTTSTTTTVHRQYVVQTPPTITIPEQHPIIYHAMPSAADSSSPRGLQSPKLQIASPHSPFGGGRTSSPTTTTLRPHPAMVTNNRHSPQQQLSPVVQQPPGGGSPQAAMIIHHGGHIVVHSPNSSSTPSGGQSPYHQKPTVSSPGSGGQVISPQQQQQHHYHPHHLHPGSIPQRGVPHAAGTTPLKPSALVTSGKVNDPSIKNQYSPSTADGGGNPVARIITASAAAAMVAGHETNASKPNIVLNTTPSAYLMHTSTPRKPLDPSSMKTMHPVVVTSAGGGSTTASPATTPIKSTILAHQQQQQTPSVNAVNPPVVSSKQVTVTTASIPAGSNSPLTVYQKSMASEPVATSTTSPANIVLAKAASGSNNTISTIMSNPNHQPITPTVVVAKSIVIDPVMPSSKPSSSPTTTPSTALKSEAAKEKPSIALDIASRKQPGSSPVKEEGSKSTSVASLVDEQETDSKEDSDCWSAKEINIDSVIKKVDALCSEDESIVAPPPLDKEASTIDLVAKGTVGALEEPKVQQQPLDQIAKESTTKKDVADGKPLAASSGTDVALPSSAAATTTPLPIDEDECDEQSSGSGAIESMEKETVGRGTGKRGGRRGGRKSSESGHATVLEKNSTETIESGIQTRTRGGKTPGGGKRGRGGRGGARGGAAMVSTTQQQHVAATPNLPGPTAALSSTGSSGGLPAATSTPKAGGRGAGAGVGGGSSSDIYEFHDDSGEDVSNAEKLLSPASGGDGARPRLILTIKNQAAVTTAPSTNTTPTTTVIATATPSPTIATTTSVPVTHHQQQVITAMTNVSTSIPSVVVTTSTVSTVQQPTTVSSTTTTTTGPSLPLPLPASEPTSVQQPPMAAAGVQELVVGKEELGVHPTTAASAAAFAAAVAAANTRKSRRLLEKDGRSTVDDIIEDVIRNVFLSINHTIYFSHYQCLILFPIFSTSAATGAGDMRKSPRSTRKGKDRKISETSTDSSDERPPPPPQQTSNANAAGSSTLVGGLKDPLAVTKGDEKQQTATAVGQGAVGGAGSGGSLSATTPVTPSVQITRPNETASLADKAKEKSKPTADEAKAPVAEMLPQPSAALTLIDPVTGELMRHSTKDGQYVPLPPAPNAPQPLKKVIAAAAIQSAAAAAEHLKAVNASASPTPPNPPNNNTGTSPTPPPSHRNTPPTPTSSGGIIIGSGKTTTIPSMAAGQQGGIVVHQQQSTTKPHPLKAHVLNSQQALQQQQPIVIKQQAPSVITSQQQQIYAAATGTPPMQTTMTTTITSKSSLSSVHSSAVPAVSSMSTPLKLTTTTSSSLHGHQQQQQQQPIYVQNALPGQQHPHPMVIGKQQATIVSGKQQQPTGGIQLHHHPGTGNLLLNIPPGMHPATAVQMSPRLHQQQPQQPLIVTNATKHQQKPQQQQVVPPPQQIIIHRSKAGGAGGDSSPLHQHHDRYTTVLQSGGKIIQQVATPTTVAPPPGSMLSQMQQQQILAKHPTTGQTIQISAAAGGGVGGAGGGMSPHPMHQAPQIMTGAVASPPLKPSHLQGQQPIVTGASSTRVALPTMSPQGPSPQGPHPPQASIQRHILTPQGTVYETTNLGPDGGFRGGMPRDYVKYIHRSNIPIPSRSPMRELPEMEETVAASPPLELRRPSSRPPHTTSVPLSLQSPGDRVTDSPQGAQVYMGSARIPHPYPPDTLNARYYEPTIGGPRALSTEPPPAHRPHNLSTAPYAGAPYSVTPSPTPPPSASPATMLQMQRERDQQQQQQQNQNVAAAIIAVAAASGQRLVGDRVVSSVPGPPPPGSSYYYRTSDVEHELTEQLHPVALGHGSSSVGASAPLPAHTGGGLLPVPVMGSQGVPMAAGRSIQVATPPGPGMSVPVPVPVVAAPGPPPPVQTDSLEALLQRYPVMWQGLLALKNDQAAVQMHFVYGNPNVAGSSLPSNSDGTTPPLRIAQRMRLEPAQIDGVARKMQMVNEHCMLLALPCGRDRMDVLQQQNNLQTGFITYLQQKQAAGIVNIAAPGSAQAAYVVHIFPSCEFANENLARIAPDLMHRVANIQYLLIVIATV
ncbi:hypothetical protein ZHAS_00008627 [Anopheles sinensis]|uniref:Protein split ends n=1 Tax=Anopheles sinensis TaxID=74873 RepID=A0A084VSR8_ANOSI|nr:hypothetical protein ZHAS_00008627 [Anopheles sinensis]